ncbi:MAG: 2Fe-2S iron-sulfur cluster binding domain-containing protein [Candidatus Latescibacteria bacterium]|nr:2Fe-2S iron-sulfur cluster binding domain-containing protein [Candidatus Latescibacterota bacterium]
MPTFTIDGKEVEIEPALGNLIRHGSKHGVHIPHYCYHAGLSVPGNCRMCMVEVESDTPAGRRKALTTACTTRPAPGMAVDTQSKLVKDTQKSVMEFLLINHPLDCPVCDQAGECDLQDYSYQYGSGDSRFQEAKVVQPKKDIGEHILLYADRCIRCTRCIRFCDEVSGTSELGYFYRGVYNEIDVFPGVRLDNRLSGNTVDICPVGALLDKEFLFKQRVWFLDGVESLCAGCSAGCNIRIDINRNNNRIYRLKPRENAEVNQFWMCDDGRHGWHYVHADTRLTAPMLRAGEGWTAASWGEALERVRQGFEGVKAGGGSVAGVLSGHLTNEENYLFARLMKEVIGSEKVGLRSKVSDEGDVKFKSGFTIRADKSPNSRGARDMASALGLTLTEMPDLLRQIEEGTVQGLYLLGGDPVERLTEAERAAFAKLKFLVVQDILTSDLVSVAHVLLPGAAFAEKEGTFTNCDGRVQRLRRAFPPPGEAKADWEVVRDAAEALGGKLDFVSAREVMEEVAQKVPGYAGMTYEALGGAGMAVQAETQSP